MVSLFPIPRLRWRTSPRLASMFFSYVSIVLVFESLQLYLHYQNSIAGSSFVLTDGDGSVFESTNLAGGNSSVEENKEDKSVLKVKGQPYIFQSLPANNDERAYYKFKKEKISPFTYKYIIDGAGVCNKDTTIIALVNSRPVSTDKRAAIRDTWGSLAHGGKWPHNRTIHGNLKLIFVFGTVPDWNKKLLEESKRYGDIIQGDFQDSYQNLTLKTLLGMRWIIDYCPNVTYYLKSDDDVFINIPYLLDILTSMPDLQRTIMGYVFRPANVMRHGKWGLNEKLYPFKKYPPYESGAAYVMTADIVGELFQAAEYFPQIYIDDAYITGLLARALGIYHARQEGFAYCCSKIPTACDILLNEVIAGHNVKAKRLRDVWAEMLKETEESCRKKPRPPPTIPAKKKPLPKKTAMSIKENPTKNKAQNIKEKT